MAPRDDDKASRQGPGQAEADVATWKADEDSSPAAAADDETVHFEEDDLQLLVIVPMLFMYLLLQTLVD